MNRIALILGEHFVYWGSLMVGLGVLCAVLLFLGLRAETRKSLMSGLAAVPVAMLLSLVLSRLIHWYCRHEAYDSFLSAMTDYSQGGYALIGAFAGCLLTALLLRLTRAVEDLPELLDQMSLAGCLGISVGRLGCFFTTGDRGMVLPDSVGMPWAVKTLNTVSGVTENRLAVFLLQAAAAAVLFAALLIFYSRGRKTGKLRQGDTCLIFLLCYCAAQAVMDSPRYDNLYFRSNGFVSIVQIFGILTVLAAAVIFTRRLVKARGGKWALTALALLPLFGGAGYMEYHVQRHGDQAAFAYTVMSLCMALAVGLILLIRHLAGHQKRIGRFCAQ